MAIIKYCGKESLKCAENVLEWLVAMAMLVIMAQGLMVICRSQNNILVYIDKALYKMGFVQVVLTTIYFSLEGMMIAFFKE